MNKLLIVPLLIVPVLHGCGDPAALSNASAADKPDYEVGDRLPESAAGEAESRAQDFREIDWDALMPASWDPMEAFKKLDLNQLQDSDPRAQKVLDQLMAEWNDAPVNPEMDGAAIRIPGFVVPLEAYSGALKEFLLVPYFGACIHVPPPPANQILHVIADEPAAGVRSMDVVWVNGVVRTVASKTDMGTSGYRVNAVRIEPYKAPPMKQPP